MPPTVARLEQVARSAGNISTLPPIAAKVIDMTANEDTPIADLEKTIEGDPALTTRVLRTVNSAAFSLREKITSLNQAISYLGFHHIRNLTTALSISKVFTLDKGIGDYDRGKLWRHLVSVGLASRMVAEHCRVNVAEDLYLAGLLHDIGIILADQHDHKFFKRYIESLEDGMCAAEQERKIMGYDHTQLGRHVARAWKLPDFVCTAIRFHHASHACRDEYAKIAQCVEVADVICTVKGITSTGKKATKPSAAVFQALDLSRDDLGTLIKQLDARLDENQHLFEI